MEEGAFEQHIEYELGKADGNEGRCVHGNWQREETGQLGGLGWRWCHLRGLADYLSIKMLCFYLFIVFAIMPCEALTISMDLSLYFKDICTLKTWSIHLLIVVLVSEAQAYVPIHHIACHEHVQICVSITPQYFEKGCHIFWKRNGLFWNNYFVFWFT